MNVLRIGYVLPGVPYGDPGLIRADDNYHTWYQRPDGPRVITLLTVIKRYPAPSRARSGRSGTFG